MAGIRLSMSMSGTFPAEFVSDWNNKLYEWLDRKLLGTRDHDADRAERRARAKDSPTGFAYTEITPGATDYIPTPAGKQLRGWGAVVDGVKRYKTSYV